MRASDFYLFGSFEKHVAGKWSATCICEASCEILATGKWRYLLCWVRSLDTMVRHMPKFKSLVSATHVPCIYLSQNNQRWGNPCTGLNRPFGFQEVEVLRFSDRQRMKVVRSAVCTSCPPHLKIFLVLIFVKGWVNQWATVQLEGLCQWKFPVTPLGIEPMTCSAVPQQTAPPRAPSQNKVLSIRVFVILLFETFF